MLHWHTSEELLVYSFVLNCRGVAIFLDFHKVEGW